MDDRLSAAQLRAGLGDDVIIGREIIVREQTTSTNDEVWQLAKGGAPEGLVVFAEYQTAGRGQRGNVWESAAHKGLWFSILLHPKIAVQDSSRLTQWAAGMISWTVEKISAQKASIKLPNDVYVGSRKIAGVLVEMRAQPRAPHIAIVGIGLNVNQQPHDFSEGLRDGAGSLAMLRQGLLNRTEVAIDLLGNLERTYRSGAVSREWVGWDSNPQPTP